MCFKIVQLKPREEAFQTVIKGLKKANAIIICEGKTEVEIFKLLAHKMCTGKGTILVTDAGGINLAIDYLRVFLAISRIIKQIKTIGTILDAEDVTPEERFHRIIDSLTSRGIQIKDTKHEGSNLYSFKTNTLQTLIAISGLPNYPKHRIENHLKELQKISNININLTSLKPANLTNTLKHLDIETLKKAFPHIAQLLTSLSQTLH